MPVEIPDAVWTSVYERGIPAAVADMLPARVRGEVSAVAAGLCGIEEVRLHTGRRITLTASGDISRAEGRSVNYPTPAVLSQAEMDGVLTLLCGGSLYACRDTIDSARVCDIPWRIPRRRLRLGGGVRRQYRRYRGRQHAGDPHPAHLAAGRSGNMQAHLGYVIYARRADIRAAGRGKNNACAFGRGAARGRAGRTPRGGGR